MNRTVHELIMEAALLQSDEAKEAFVQGISEEERQRIMELVEGCFGFVKGINALIEMAIAGFSRWWNQLPAELRNAIMEGPK